MLRLGGVAVLVLTVIGIVLLGSYILVPSPLQAVNEKGEVVVSGLSPALAACYTVESRISSLIIGIGFGLIMGLMYYFGNFVYKKFRDSVVVSRPH
jgi:ABC-type nitrate/sulfonate/bicarbonate transport system permease component